MVVAAAPDSDDAPSQSKPKLSRAERNRANAVKSTGPRSITGKSRSKYNALKHGLAAETVVLPGENRDRYEATREEYHNWIAPRNPLEALYVNCIVDDAWTLERTKRLAAAQLAEAVRSQTIDQDLADRSSMVECSRLLLKNITDPALCLCNSQNGGPEHPSRLVAALETTVAGCDWLLARFRELAMHLRASNIWCAQDGYALIRLTGFNLGEVNTDDAAALLLMASQSVSAEPLAPSICDEEDLADDNKRMQGRRTSGYPACTPDKLTGNRGRNKRLVAGALIPLGLTGRQTNIARLEALVPSDVDHARRQLGLVIDDAIARLEELRALRAQDAEARAADAPDRIAASGDPDRHLERRYVMEHRRALNSTVNTFLKLRAAIEAGKLGTLEADSDHSADAVATNRPRQQAADSNPRPQERPKQSSLLDQLVAENLAAPDAREDTLTSRTELIPFTAAPDAREDTPIYRNEATTAGPATAPVPPSAPQQAPIRSHSPNEATAAGPRAAPPQPAAPQQAPTEAPSRNEATAADPAAAPPQPAAPQQAPTGAPSRNEATTPGPAATPVPPSAPQQAPTEAHCGNEGTTPGPAATPPQPRAPQQAPIASHSRNEATTAGPAAAPLATRQYPPRSQWNWELIPETQRGHSQRYKDYQRRLQAEFGVTSPEEFRRKYRKDPPLG
jgi:hypothetical protein